MATNDHARHEKLWKNYSESGLSTLLLHDTWHWRTALPILCNIESHQTNMGDDLVETIEYEPQPLQPSGNPFATTISISSFFPLGGFVNLSLFSDGSLEPFPLAKSCSRASEMRLVHKLIKIRGISTKRSDFQNIRQELSREVKTRTRANYDAFVLLDQVVPVFKSNPKHTEIEKFAPEYFIKWAKEKDIEIAWLEWAKTRGYLVQGSIESQTKTKETPVNTTASAQKRERNEERERQNEELRARALKIAIKLKRDGLPVKRITIIRICEDLFKESFSSGKPFTSRWKSVEGMRSLLKEENHPKATDEFRKAKSDRGKFNP